MATDILRFSLAGVASEASYAVLGMLGPREATALRGASTTLRDAVAAHPWRWGDAAYDASVRGDLASWRACFPAADAVRITSTTRCHGRLLDVDAFALLAGVRWLDISECCTITDAAFVHLAGVHTLDISYCDQLSDAAIEHIAGVRDLTLIGRRITGAAFRWLRGIERLCIYGEGGGANIDDASFVHLAGVRELVVHDCSQLTGAFMQHLARPRAEVGQGAVAHHLPRCRHAGRRSAALCGSRGHVAGGVRGVLCCGADDARRRRARARRRVRHDTGGAGAALACAAVTRAAVDKWCCRR